MAAAVLVGGTLALAGAFGGDGSDGDETATDAAESEIEAVRVSLTESLEDKRQGISATYPKTWRSSNPRGERLLESRDRCMAIKLSAPARADQAARLRRDTLTAIRKGLRNSEVAPGEQGEQIGGLPTTQDQIAVPSGKGREARILVAVGVGKARAYLTEIVLHDASCGRTLLESQLIIQSIRYTR